MGMMREHHIKVLEQFLHDYQEWGEDLELEKTIKYAISSLKTDLKYDLMYEGEEIFTKADVVAMLTELKTEIDIMSDSVVEGRTVTVTSWRGMQKRICKLIQSKIDKTKVRKEYKTDLKIILNRLKVRMKDRDEDNGGEPLNNFDKGYHTAFIHLCKEIDSILSEQEIRK